MEDKKFKATLVILVPLVVQEIVKSEGLDEISATKDFYGSKVYLLLEDEMTKLWHFSPKTLYQMYRSEVELGEILFPEGV